MSSTLERNYALRSDQTLSIERRVALSEQVRTQQIVAAVRQNFTRWEDAVGRQEDGVIIHRCSSNVQQAIANIMRRNEWSPSVEEAVQSIMGGHSSFYIQMATRFAELNPNERQLQATTSEVETADDWSEDDEAEEDTLPSTQTREQHL